MIQKLAEFVTAKPKLIIILCFLLMLPCLLGYFATGINYDLLSYLPDDLESVTSLDILDENFQFAASSIVVLEGMKSKDVVKVKQEIEKIDCVVQVLWTDSIVDTSVPVEILPDFAKDIFYSDDGSATMFIVQYSTSTSDELTLQAVRTIRGILRENCFISGISAAVEDIKEICETEFFIYIAIAVVVALITLSFTMKTLFMPLALFSALACAVILNMGTNFFLGEISFISQCIAAVLQLAVTLDYSIFLVDRFEEELKITPDNNQLAMQKAIKASFVSLFSSSLTTVFGFLALCFMTLTIGVDLGVVMAKGVFFGAVMVLTLLPAILLQFHSILNKFQHKRLVPNFEKISAFTMRHKKAFVILFVVLMIPSYFMKNQMGIYYNIIKALPEDTPSLIALEKIKNDFDMASTHFLILPSDTPSKDVEKIMNEIEKLDGIVDVLSLNTVLGSAIDKSVLPEIVNDICNKDGYTLAMINTTYDAGSNEANIQVQTIRQIIERYCPDGMATGEAVLMCDLAITANRDLILTSVISILAILLLIMFAFKSLSIPFILVLAIELAIFINQTISWIMGTQVSFIAPIVLSCVQLGATVDYAILLTGRYQENLAAGMHSDKAAEKASATAMKSIFQSALVFFTVTASIAITCDIRLITELCVMLARGSIISATIILFLLAPTLNTFESLIKKTSRDWPIPNPLHQKPVFQKTKRNGPKETIPVAATAANAAFQANEQQHTPERRYIQSPGTINPPSARTQARTGNPIQPPMQQVPIQPPAQSLPMRPTPPRPTTSGAQARPVAAQPPRPVQPPTPQYPMPQQGISRRPAAPTPQQGMPQQRPAAPTPQQGMPQQRPAAPTPQQGMYRHPAQQPMHPYPGVPVRTAQQPQGYTVPGYPNPYYPPYPGYAQPMPQYPVKPAQPPVQKPKIPVSSKPAEPQARTFNEINEQRRRKAPAPGIDPFEVNPYANQPSTGKKGGQPR